MITIDHLLLEIENYGFEKISSSISRRDIRILKNLANLVKLANFITENQGTLLVKILTENFRHLNFLGSSLSEALTTPSWSRKFRYDEDIKKITIFSENDEKFIKIESAPNSHFLKILSNIEKKSTGTLSIVGNKVHLLPLSEKNVFLIVDYLKSENFDISEEILDFYETIRSWSKEDVEKKFQIESLENKKILKKLEDDLSLNSDTDELLLADRKIRYQYHFPPKISPSSLKEIIAHRPSNKIFVDSTKYQFEELLDSLVALKKLPALLVFPSFSEYDCIRQLDLITLALDKKKLTDSVGIYFRFENQGKGPEFNQRIAKRQFNKQLDLTTKIAGVINGKIPKFFFKTNWQPNSVISFTNSLRNNKTSVYCNNCDLIVYYTDKLPFVVST